MSFEEISHTADVKIRARALTHEALFSDAFLALMQVVYGTDRKGGITKEIDLILSLIFFQKRNQFFKISKQNNSYAIR